MHLLDLVLLVIIAGWAIVGAFAGIVPQLNTLLSILIGALGAWIFYPIISYKIEGLIDSPEISVILAPILLFIIIGLISKILINLFCKVVFSEETYKSGWILGGSFGMLKGIIVGGIIVYFLGQYGKPELMQDSISFKRYYSASKWVVDASNEYGISNKFAAAGNYLQEKILPPKDNREESIESAATDFYNNKLTGYFKKDFFKSASEFFSSKDSDE